MQKEELIRLRANLMEKGVKLIAVSKMKTPAEILEVYGSGQRIFGENKVQDLVPKYDFLPKDIEWHMIGHLQTNKVKYIAPFVAMIQSVDSFNLLQEINKRAAKVNRVIDFLFQIRIAKEETKFGLSEQELMDMLNHPDIQKMKNVKACGVMGIATLTDDMNEVRREFHTLKKIFDRVKHKYFAMNDHFREISMGMSGDYQMAIEEGSTMVRLGTLIFGERFIPTPQLRSGE